MKGKTHEETRLMWEQMRQYKAQGCTHKEVAEAFGVSLQTCWKVCKGIAPQPIKPGAARNQYTSGGFDREAHQAQKIKEYMPQFEYVRGFTDADGSVVVRCVVCGTEQTKSLISIRHHTCCCNTCKDNARQERIKAEEQAKQAKEEERKAIKAAREAEARAKEEAKKHACPVCGMITTRKKYCSDGCLHKAMNTAREARRRTLIRDVLVDKDITLEALYKRDNGYCYICGMKCRWEDYTTRNNIFIAGDWYPSIDHVKPISKGGAHAWGNVRLAHRVCNTWKRDNPLCLKDS